MAESINGPLQQIGKKYIRSDTKTVFQQPNAADFVFSAPLDVRHADVLGFIWDNGHVSVTHAVTVYGSNLDPPSAAATGADWEPISDTVTVSAADKKTGFVDVSGYLFAQIYCDASATTGTNDQNLYVGTKG